MFCGGSGLQAPGERRGAADPDFAIFSENNNHSNRGADLFNNQGKPAGRLSLGFPEFVEFLVGFALLRFRAGEDPLLPDRAHGEDRRHAVDTDRQKMEEVLDRLDAGGRFFRGNDEFFHGEAWAWAQRHDEAERGQKERAVGTFRMRLSAERDELERRKGQGQGYLPQHA